MNRPTISQPSTQAASGSRQPGAAATTDIDKLNAALSMHRQGQLDRAATLCRELLQSQPQHLDALHLLATIYATQLNFLAAVDLFDQALKIRPDYAQAHFDRANALRGLGRREEALESYGLALAIQPEHIAALNNRGNALYDLGQYEHAIDSYDRALALQPDNAAVLNNRGNSLCHLNRHEEALASYELALTIQPDSASALNSRGNALHELKRHEEALESYARALAIKPDYALALNNQGNTLLELKRHAQALESYARALAVKPDYADAHFNRGNALRDLRRHQESVASYDLALAIQPDHIGAINNRGNALCDLKQYEQALESYALALRIDPEYEFLYGTWLLTKLKICDWSDADDQVAQLAEKIERREKVSASFAVLAITGTLSLQRKAAEIWVQAKHHVSNALPGIGKYAHDRIRIGYFSSDFQNHATMSLMAGLFELHDKSRFELIAFSFGPDDNDGMRRRVSAAFDNFIDVSSQTDRNVAMLARSMEIDIAIDLKGFTQDNRHGIFAYRAAPVQVNYLGYPGTLGAEYIDYLIADATLIPEESQQYYSENIVYLPHSYQVNDSRRSIADRTPSRTEYGLPQAEFVFCCFNSNYKITPGTFDCWMRILKQVEASVLWLFEDNARAPFNLRREAVHRGVSAERLVFAKKLTPPEHLARYRLADLFLDTLPCNAHTTASDALWAGLPVLTCLGETFAGRVAASLLNAIGLPELVTSTPAAYEALAIELARSPGKMSAIKRKLADNRLTAPLFDSQRFTRHLEAAYSAMYARHRADLAPGHIRVS